jgi:hypothetical protein
MSRETFDGIIEGLRAFPDLREIYFSGFGEPLTPPHITEMVRRAKSLGVRVTVGEDAGEIRAGHAPLVLAAVRNALLNLHCWQGWHNMPSATTGRRSHVHWI